MNAKPSPEFIRDIHKLIVKYETIYEHALKIKNANTLFISADSEYLVVDQFIKNFIYNGYQNQLDVILNQLKSAGIDTSSLNKL